MSDFTGLFLGLSTIDIIYELDTYPGVNKKTVAGDQLILAGGPATNAAVAFSILGGQSVLCSSLGVHPHCQFIRDELKRYDLQMVDLQPENTGPPIFSSIMVMKGSGERSIVYTKAENTPVDDITRLPLSNVVDVVLVDAHQMAASRLLCAKASELRIPSVLDGGSWKDRTNELLPFIDYAICSEDFFPPGCSSSDDVFRYLYNRGVAKIAITRGERSIITFEDGKTDLIPINSQAAVRSTLGAGDILHGAFCYYLLSLNGDFQSAIRKASQIASRSCRFLGTRRW
jgi:sugar/nucleoside kinase (ribokinase family)